MALTELTTTVGADGVLTMSIPLGPQAALRPVRVIVEPESRLPATQQEWRDFIFAVAGSITDPTFQRPDQGVVEEREELP